MIYNIKIGKKEISIWQSSTFLPLSGKPRKAISELDIEKLNSDNGVETTLAKFHPLYLMCIVPPMTRMKNLRNLLDLHIC